MHSDIFLIHTLPGIRISFQHGVIYINKIQISFGKSSLISMIKST